MTTLSDFQVTDDVTDNLASYHNRLLGGICYSKFTNTETLLATKELADGDCQFQIITASGADRTVELPPEADTNHFFIIFNTGASNNVVVKDDSASVTFATLAPNEWMIFIPVYGEGWKTLENRVTLKAYFDTVYGAGDVTLTGTQTLTNKRITPRVTSISSSATPTINTDTCDFVDITALAADITSMTTNLSGTPTNGQKLIIRFKDNGTARAITWGTGWDACGISLPTTTVISKRLTVGFIYDTTTSKWGCVASVQEA